MKATLTLERPTRLELHAATAADLMTTNPMSVRENATVREAMNLLIDRGYSAAPVIDAAGRPVGVLSRSDLLIHDRETAEHLRREPEFYHKGDLHTGAGELLGRGFQVEKVDRTRVADVMTPAVFCVSPADTTAKVVADLLRLKVHRLFVVDDDGVLVGVISAMDVVRHLQPPA
jgi:CBS domain-containing protein